MIKPKIAKQKTKNEEEIVSSNLSEKKMKKSVSRKQIGKQEETTLAKNNLDDDLKKYDEEF